MAPSPMDKQTACCKSPYNWLVRFVLISYYLYVQSIDRRLSNNITTTMIVILFESLTVLLIIRINDN